MLNTGADTWSRPSDAAVAPDGAVFVADWYDPGVGGHNMGDMEGNRGRIYRLAPTGNRPTVPALDLTSDAGLTAALSSANPTRQYLAYQAIKAKGAAGAPVLQSDVEAGAIRSSALARSGCSARSAPMVSARFRKRMKDQDPRFRILALRVARLQRRRHAGDRTPARA